MTRKTYRIELKIDFEDDARHEHMNQVAVGVAQQMLAAATLLCDGRKPLCALLTDDSYTGIEEHNINPELT